jgi:hypothetical protein
MECSFVPCFIKYLKIVRYPGNTANVGLLRVQTSRYADNLEDANIIRAGFELSVDTKILKTILVGALLIGLDRLG